MLTGTFDHFWECGPIISNMPRAAHRPPAVTTLSFTKLKILLTVNKQRKQALWKLLHSVTILQMSFPVKL